MNIRDDAHLIIKEAIDRTMPDNAVKAALGSVSLPHKVKMVAIGKGRELNAVLGMTARNLFVFGLVTAAQILFVGQIL